MRYAALVLFAVLLLPASLPGLDWECTFTVSAATTPPGKPKRCCTPSAINALTSSSDPVIFIFVLLKKRAVSQEGKRL